MNGAGISKVVSALLIIMGTTTVIMVGTCVAAEDDQQPQEVLRIYDILVRGRGEAMVDNDLGCVPAGQPCNAGMNECCPGSRCRAEGAGLFGGTKCEWCPGVGDPCGAFHSCCPGLSCDGTINGKCHK